ncbi:MAG: hypothetical protein IT467_00850 [Dokdonella sp.]|uniref:hypothetical protein n=1 Tax=Dokdonella sp. TaxID=2291710 RepID=UPI0025B7ED5F|nr:hypothetical protein [Dokdonella sp.]MBZ0223621.1 hypothetical protein [Dokdonella sp.]MCC7254460.1 hypothetical protein [Dokdonella sp.]
MGVFAKAFAVWCAILVLAIANGALREGVLIPRLGLHAGMILSGVLLAALIVLVSTLCLPWFDLQSTRALLLLGLGWLGLTLAFEWSFGLLRGKSTSELLAAYAFKDGNLWTLVLLVTLLAPLLAAWLRGTR